MITATLPALAMQAAVEEGEEISNVFKRQQTLEAVVRNETRLAFFSSPLLT